MGYQIGNRVMIGIPGQTYESLAGNIEIFRELDLDMVGVGPYIPHPETPVAIGEWKFFIPDEEQVPNLTPLKYRPLYEIYPSKACIRETEWECHSCLTHRIHSIGRGIGIGRGDRIHRIDSRGSLLVERKGRAEKGGFKDKGLLI
jgi:biotin synthase